VQVLGARTGLLASGACVVALCAAAARARSVRDLRVQVEAAGSAGFESVTSSTTSL
jgi:hypothetical protein